MKLFWRELLRFLLNKEEEILLEVALQVGSAVAAVDTHREEVVVVKELAHNMEHQHLNKVGVEALVDILREAVEVEAQEAILKEVVVEGEALEVIPKEEVVVQVHLAHTVLLNKEVEEGVALVDILRVDEEVGVEVVVELLN